MARRVVLAAVFTVTSAMLPGCSDPRFKAAQAERNRRIESLLTNYATFEMAGLQRAKLYVDFLKLNESRPTGGLAADFAAIGDGFVADARRWRETGSPFGEWFLAQLPGHPERIPDTVAKMIY